MFLQIATVWIQLPVDLEVYSLALHLGNATATGRREPRIGSGGSEVALPILVVSTCP